MHREAHEHQHVRPAETPIFMDPVSQMSYGERAALEGFLTQIRPALAIEIGVAEGGSLHRLAAYAEEVHAFDLVSAPAAVAGLSNVHFHLGDSHTLLPRLLATFEETGRCVDFVLVDGDHSAPGVRRDVEDLLASTAVTDTLILLHDTMNEEVRSGLEQVSFSSYPKVAYVDLDCVPGHLFVAPELRNELWGGFGIVLVDTRHLAYFATSPLRRYAPSFPILNDYRDRLRAEQAIESEATRPMTEGL